MPENAQTITLDLLVQDGLIALDMAVIQDFTASIAINVNRRTVMDIAANFVAAPGEPHQVRASFPANAMRKASEFAESHVPPPLRTALVGMIDQTVRDGRLSRDIGVHAKPLHLLLVSEETTETQEEISTLSAQYLFRGNVSEKLDFELDCDQGTIKIHGHIGPEHENVLENVAMAAETGLVATGSIDIPTSLHQLAKRITERLRESGECVETYEDPESDFSVCIDLHRVQGDA